MILLKRFLKCDKREEMTSNYSDQMIHHSNWEKWKIEWKNNYDGQSGLQIWTASCKKKKKKENIVWSPKLLSPFPSPDLD